MRRTTRGPVVPERKNRKTRERPPNDWTSRDLCDGPGGLAACRERWPHRNGRAHGRYRHHPPRRQKARRQDSGRRRRRTRHWLSPTDRPRAASPGRYAAAWLGRGRRARTASHADSPVGNRLTMDRGTGIGLGLALISILGAAVVEAGSTSILFALMNLPSAMIVFGGTIGALIVAFPLERVTQLGKVLGVAFRQEVTSERDLVTLFVRLAERARREGLLALESEAQSIEDASIKKGVLLVVDGTDPDLVREIME